MPEPPRSAFQYAIVRVAAARRARRVPQRRGRPAVPAAALPRRADRARRDAGWPRSRPTSTRRPIRPHLEAIERIAAGDPSAGPIARLGQAERFHWLVVAVEHDHPAVRGPHRAVRRPGGRARPPRRDARRLAAAGRRPSRQANRAPRPRRRASSRRPLRAARSRPRSISADAVGARRPRSARNARSSRSASGRAARPPVSGSSSRKLRAPSPDRSIGLARLGADDVADRAARARSIAGSGGPSRQLDEQDRRRPAVAGVTGGLVAERRRPSPGACRARPGDGSRPAALGRRRARCGRSRQERLDVLAVRGRPRSSWWCSGSTNLRGRGGRAAAVEERLDRLGSGTGTEPKSTARARRRSGRPASSEGDLDQRAVAGHRLDVLAVPDLDDLGEHRAPLRLVGDDPRGRRQVGADRRP